MDKSGGETALVEVRGVRGVGRGRETVIHEPCTVA